MLSIKNSEALSSDQYDTTSLPIRQLRLSEDRSTGTRNVFQSLPKQPLTSCS